jgi:two-component system, chemotaxis family, chemotaxis protein CheY
MRILIAEDDLDISNLYKKALVKHKHHVVLTSNGSDCLTNYLTTLRNMRSNPKHSKVDAHKANIHSLGTSVAKGRGVVDTSSSPYDVVILDYSMPGMNGMEVAKEILDAEPQQRIIFASAYVKDTLEDSVKELKQVVELMQKPFSLKQLTDTVEDTLVFEELKGLNVDVDRIKGADLTHAQIFDLLARLRRIQKNRTF